MGNFDLIDGVEELLKQENLLKNEIVANNKRLDIYRERTKQHERFCEIMKSLRKNSHDSDGVVENFKENDGKLEKQYLISESAYERLVTCSSWFEFETSLSWQEHRVKRANRCMHKYCPHCSRVLALRRSLEANHYMERLDNDGYRFIFLTLTVKNESHENMKTLMTHMNKSVADRFLKYVEIKKQFHGFIRKFEITYNKTRDDFHPHIHLIVAVKKSYFNGKNYISQKKYRAYWKKALKVDYLPQVDVRVVEKKDLLEDKENLEQAHLENMESENFVHGAFEIGKYVAKSSEYLGSSEIFEIFYKILFKRRNWSFGGVFKDLHLENKHKRFETELENNEIEYKYVTQYNHNRKTNDYVLTKVTKNNT